MRNYPTIYVISILLLLLSYTNVYSQKSNHTLSISMCYGMAKPDTRYDFLYLQYPVGVVDGVQINLRNTTLDDEYSIGLRYSNHLTRRINFGFTLGYNLLVQDFSIPADGNGYFRQTIQPFFWRDLSRYHMAQISPFVDVFLVKRNWNFGMNAQFTANTSFKKHINSFDLNRWNIEYFASEVYPGVFSEYKKMRIDLSFRLLHWKRRDHAIANNGLEIDRYNPFKMRFQVSYILGRR
jgi:hypothetical protein